MASEQTALPGLSVGGGYNERTQPELGTEGAHSERVAVFGELKFHSK